MDDYNIEFQDRQERSCLESIINPFDLTSLNNCQPTRYSKTRDALIDYTIIGNSVKNIYSEIFDASVRSNYFSHLVILDKNWKKKLNQQRKQSII